jgi:predicted P-loop ATPase
MHERVYTREDAYADDKHQCTEHLIENLHVDVPIVDKGDPDVVPVPLFKRVPPCIEKYFGHVKHYCNWVFVRDKNGKWKKVPKAPLAGDRNASTADPSTWGDLTAAILKAEQASWGVGIMIAEHKGFCCVDIDDGRKADGLLLPWAADIVARCGSYTEISPSGTGVKIYGLLTPGAVPPGGYKITMDGGEVELFYAYNRYLCVTGVQYGDITELTDITAVVADLHAAAMQEKERKKGERQEEGRQEDNEERPAIDARGAAGDYFRNVNAAALADLKAWVPRLFPSAAYQPGTGAWRVKQADLNTAFEEDLSIHPQGIRNFGTECAATAIDLVLEFGGAPKPIDAVDWLCEQMGIDPYSIGKQRRKQKQERAEDEDLSDWRFTFDSKGMLLCTTSNVRKTLTESPQWRGVFQYNELTMRAELSKPIPQPDGKVPNDFVAHPIVDGDILDAQCVLQNGAYPRLAKATMADAIEVVARAAPYNPLQDYLSGLAWDGKSRIGQWLVNYCSADLRQHNPVYVEAVGRAWLISAVARAMRPGCKADAALVMVGEQGVGKSSAASILAGEWFSDSLPPVDTKDAADHLRGRWILELPEMAVYDRATVEASKAFLSRTHESFRPAYSIKEITFPRSCVFFGSTNQLDGFLRDVTGNRRFWPVIVGRIDLAALLRDRDQLWAEALQAFRSGEAWYLPSGIAPLAAEETAAFVLRDEREEILEKVLRNKTQTTVLECCSLLDLSSDKLNQMNVSKMLRSIGWKQARNKKSRWWERVA